MGAIHELRNCPLKRVEAAFRDSYIRFHDHRFRGAIPGLWSRSWPPLARRPAPLVVPDLRFERRSPWCNGGILPLDEPGSAASIKPHSGWESAGWAFSLLQCPIFIRNDKPEACRFHGPLIKKEMA
jgi:hypothetical protein